VTLYIYKHTQIENMACQVFTADHWVLVCCLSRYRKAIRAVYFNDFQMFPFVDSTISWSKFREVLGLTKQKSKAVVVSLLVNELPNVTQTKLTKYDISIHTAVCQHTNTFNFQALFVSFWLLLLRFIIITAITDFLHSGSLLLSELILRMNLLTGMVNKLFSFTEHKATCNKPNF